ncbi:HD domain-containing protein [Candidatus Nanosalina sp. VS9-1]|uniref:HD domain-containing protein n=1 Tax=Candidatus Nanosalina sp. VS9-1 TaxID=3388566 RepID=UPI0039DF748A
MKHIQDALHGYIELNSEEVNVLDSAQMQRLRRIRQLGLSSLVYPSATHTRFQHSLGVMHIAGRFAESLDLDDQRSQELRIAGLLHDSGHGPFSHASEVVAEKHGFSHEDFSCRIIDELEDEYSVESQRVKKIIKGDLEIGQIVAGDIDADRMDYLMRDSHASGLEHGEIDYDTIIRLAEIDSRRLVFSEKAVQALESLFTARFHMIKTLYNHHTSLIAEKMLQRSLENLIEEENIAVEEMMQLDDYEAHSKLLNSKGSSRKLYSRIKDRNLYKRALVWDIDDVPKEALKSLERRIKKPRKLEKEIAEEADTRPDEVIIHTPSTPGISDIDVKVKKKGDIRPLSELSPIPDALTDAEWRNVALRVYAPDEKVDEVREASRKILKDYTKVLEGYT